MSTHFSRQNSPEWEVDFASLASQDPEFARFYDRQSHSIDFNDSDAVRQLTISTLRSRYGIELILPDDRLCPPVPNRIKYVEWIQELVRTSDPALPFYPDDAREVVGMDIGVGSSCIYPLLAATLNPSWKIVGTEVDSINYSSAIENVQRNKLSDRILLVKTTAEGPLLGHDQFRDKDSNQRLDFTMCNPPFFSSKGDMELTYISKREPPPAVCTGAEIEMITEGGDIGFAIRILNESLSAKETSQWYTCMVGKKSSLYALVEELRQRRVNNWAVTCLDVGAKTRRWCVGWSFGPWRASQDASRSLLLDKSLFPPATEVYISHSGNASSLREMLSSILKELPLKTEWDVVATTSPIARILASGPVWSRSARRKRQRESDTPGKPAESTDGLTPETAQFAVTMTIEKTIVVRWLKGDRHEDFTSFCGMIRTKLRLENKG